MFSVTQLSYCCDTYLSCGNFLLITAVRIDRQPESRKVEYNSGDVLDLVCEASGPHPLIYTWCKDGQAVQSSTSGHLRIAQIAPLHSGCYTCNVCSGASHDLVKSHTVSISVCECTCQACLSVSCGEIFVVPSEMSMVYCRGQQQAGAVH